VPLVLCAFNLEILIMPEKIISIFGSGGAKPGRQALMLAEKIGRLLAEAGFTIANGGYGGTMSAAAKGAAGAGGEIIGVTCTAFGPEDANKYITRQIVTTSLEERLKKLIELGQAYVVLPGGTGTLLELASVWELKNKGFLKKDKPIILVGRFWMPLVDLIAAEDSGSSRWLKPAESPQETVDYLAGLFKSQPD